MKSALLNICLVGLGRAGHFHFNSVNKIDYLNLKYIVEPNPEALKGVEGKGRFTHLIDIDQALADATIDAVIVASPTQFHYDYIIRSLAAGKHVFTEKPLGYTLKEIQECFDLAAEKGLCLHLGFQRRFDENFTTLNANLPKLGVARLVKTSSRDNPKPSLDYLKISGNIYHDMLIHDFDMLLFLFGLQVPASIFSIGYAYDAEIADLKDFDTVLVTLKYESGLMVSIDTSRTAPYGYDQRIEIFGEHGMICAENEQENTVKIFDHQGISAAKAAHSFPQRYKDAYFAELVHFGKAILNGIPNNVTKEECVLAHLIADAAYESAIKNEVIDFKAFYANAIRGEGGAV